MPIRPLLTPLCLTPLSLTLYGRTDAPPKEVGLTDDFAEGVLSLERAVQAAGARALVMSLWSVDDAATAILMEKFYAKLWLKKLQKLEVLRQAQLTMLRHPKRVDQRRNDLRQILVKRGMSEKLSAPRHRQGSGRVAGRRPSQLERSGVVRRRGGPRSC